MRHQKRRILGWAALGLGAALAIAGCGAGQITQTANQEPAVNGAHAQVQTMSIRDASVVFPDNPQRAYAEGATAPLKLSIINQGNRDDELVSVTSAAASNVGAQGSNRVVAGRTLVVGPAGTAGPGGPGEKAKGRTGRASITLNGLTRDIRPGQVINVTFTFRDAGAVTVEMPIGAPPEPAGPQQDAGPAER